MQLRIPSSHAIDSDSSMKSARGSYPLGMAAESIYEMDAARARSKRVSSPVSAPTRHTEDVSTRLSTLPCDVIRTWSLTNDMSSFGEPVSHFLRTRIAFSIDEITCMAFLKVYRLSNVGSLCQSWDLISHACCVLYSANLHLVLKCHCFQSHAGAHDAELFHAELQGRAVQPQPYRCAARSCKDPSGLF